jgi:hypothetical protein
VAAGLQALDFANFPPFISNGSCFVSVLAGWAPPETDFRTWLPAMGLTFDYAVGGSMMLGANAGFSAAKKGNTTCWYFTAGPSVSWHPDLGVKNLDVYFKFTSGYEYYTIRPGIYLPVYYAAAVGLAYYFGGSRFALYTEDGYSKYAVAGGGIRLRVR